MNANLKVMLENILTSRAFLYSLYHKLLGTQMTPELMQTVCSDNSLETIKILVSDENLFAQNFSKFLKQYQNTDDSVIDQISDEYTRLFIGPARLVAPPWESVYTSIDHTLFQLSTLSVRMWYQRYGYEVGNEEKTADDHIALMMHFLSLSTEKALEHFLNEDADMTRIVLADQKKFITQHITTWIDKYAENMQNSSSSLFYPMLVKHLRLFIMLDIELVDELISLV